MADDIAGDGTPLIAAATVLLTRDRPGGLEVFMVSRRQEIDSFAGALVFPGGKVDAGDGAAALRACARGAGDHDERAFALRVAAIREAFEEAGILLARRAGENALLGAGALAPIEARYRLALQKGEATLLQLAQEQGLELALDCLVPFGHWITPRAQPRIFDTHFFLAAAPADQVALHDGHEAQDSVWLTPLAAIADAEAGRRAVVFPTRMNLKKLARWTTVAAALAACARLPVVTVQPLVSPHDRGRVLSIPAEAGYGVTRILATKSGEFVVLETG